MTPADLRAILDKATPRPWEPEFYSHIYLRRKGKADSRVLAVVDLRDSESVLMMMNLADKFVKLWYLAHQADIVLHHSAAQALDGHKVKGVCDCTGCELRQILKELEEA